MRLSELSTDAAASVLLSITPALSNILNDPDLRNKIGKKADLFRRSLPLHKDGRRADLQVLRNRRADQYGNVPRRVQYIILRVHR